MNWKRERRAMKSWKPENRMSEDSPRKEASHGKSWKQPDFITESPAPLQTSVTGHSRGLGRQGRRRTNTRIGWKSVWEAPRHARYLLCSLQPSDCPSPSPQEEADFILSRMVSGQHQRPYWKDNVPVSFHSLKPLDSYLDPHNDGRQIFTLQADDGTSLLWKTWSAQGQKRWKDL